MKTILKYAAALLPLVAACYLTAADDAASKASTPQLPTLTVQAVTTDDPSGYATWVAKGNESFKAAGGPDQFTHVYQGIVAGEETGKLFAVRIGESAVALAKNGEALMQVPGHHDIADHLAAIRKLGGAEMLQAVHFEGGYPGEWIFVTHVQVSGEPAYLQALGELRGLLDSHDLKDLKVNVFRVIAGRANYSHEVVISAPSHERIAAMLDSLSTPWMGTWLASLSGMRTFVSNGIYHEISK